MDVVYQNIAWGIVIGFFVIFAWINILIYNAWKNKLK